MAEYLTTFQNHAQYQAFTGTSAYIRPNVSLCQLEEEVHYGPVLPDMLTFIAINDCTFSFDRNENPIYYTTDKGETWTALSSGTSTPVISAGSEITWKAEFTPVATSGIGRFSSSGSFNAKGTPMSLLYGENIANKDSLADKEQAFRSLFSGCTGLVSAKHLSLPATTLATYCYSYMFYGCTNLTAAPELPATTLVTSCYGYMFRGCTSLATAPELPATALASSCYSYMFQGCTSLTTAQELPATTLATSCYSNMFNGCTSLTIAPELPATTLANYCYGGMFQGCTSLTAAQMLPTNITMSNISYMFNNCTSLASVADLTIECSETSGNLQAMFRNCSALTDASNITLKMSYVFCPEMFYGCTSLQKSPIIDASFQYSTAVPSTNLPGSSMFYNCSALTQITYFGTTLGCSRAGVERDGYSDAWVYNVAPTGTFIKKAGVTITYKGSSACGSNTIPCNWTVVEQ